MGGRMASHLGANPGDLVAPIAALVFLGYPLRPPGPARQDSRGASLVDRRADAVGPGHARRLWHARRARPVFLTGLPATVLRAIDKADHSFKVSSVRDKQAVVFEKILDDLWWRGSATTCGRGWKVGSPTVAGDVAMGAAVGDKQRHRLAGGERGEGDRGQLLEVGVGALYSGRRPNRNVPSCPARSRNRSDRHTAVRPCRWWSAGRTRAAQGR